MTKPAGIPGGLSRFRVDLAYDGTDFAGWAKQPGLRTVQNEFVKAFEKLFGPSDNDYGIRIAGRTDAGVHATHQVFHMDLTPEHVKRLGRTPLSAKRLRGLLPGDIGVFQIARAPQGFHARYSATGRSYEYSISDALCKPDPLNLRYSLQSRRTYDVALMRDAAVGLLGLKEFGAFCRPRAGASTIRELRLLDVVRQENGQILIKLEADAFCHNMVRALVGALCAVGEKKLTKEELWKIQTAAVRTSKFKVVEPKGLKLVAVSYPADDQLEIQAQRVRKMRLTEEITV